MRLFLAAVLGALAMFTWEFVAHMFTPLGEAGISYLPAESAVSDALASSIGDQAGMYMFPTGGLTKDSTRAEKEKGMQRIMEEMKTKPSGLLVYKPAGTTFNFGKSLGVQFLTDLLKAFLAVALLARARRETFAGRLGFVVMAGVLAAIATNIAYWNWYGFNGTYTISNIVMEIGGFFFAGLAIAAVFKPAPVAQ